MSEKTKNTVASNAAKIEAVNEKLEQKAESLDAVNARLAALEAEDAKLKESLAEKDAEITALKAALALKAAAPTTDNAEVKLIEVVYDPPGSLTKFHADLRLGGRNGQSFQPIEHDDGYMHFRVPENLVWELFVAGDDSHYKFVGSDDEFRFVRGGAVNPVEHIVKRHALGEKNGVKTWLPVEVEESVQPPPKEDDE